MFNTQVSQKPTSGADAAVDGEEEEEAGEQVAHQEGHHQLLVRPVEGGHVVGGADLIKRGWPCDTCTILYLSNFSFGDSVNNDGAVASRRLKNSLVEFSMLLTIISQFQDL
jgi:hypothetical protein